MTKPLDNDQKRIIGAAYTLERLSPRSPYGKTLAGRIAPYGRNERPALERELNAAAKAAKVIADYPALHNDLSHALSRFRDINGSVNRLGTGGRAYSDVEFFEIKGFLIDLSALAKRFDEYVEKAPLEGIEFQPMEAALDILDPDGGRLRAFHVCGSYSERLTQIRRDKRDVEALMETEFGQDPANGADLALKRLEITAREDEEERAVRAALADRLAPYKELFLRNIDNVGRLDLTLAKAELAAASGCVLPEITENRIDMLDMYSPETDAALKERGGSMTPASLRLYPGTCVVTGANMGGKSVALKTLALNAYLFQCGFLVYAKKAALPIFDNIDFILGDSGSVWTGLSSFGAEMSAVNEILSRAEEGFSLIILDEPARGTNPGEGRAVAAALAKRLNALPSISVIATHYDNVAGPPYRGYTAAGLKKDLLAAAVKLSPDMIPGLMDYRLIETSSGASVPKDALTICRLLGLDKELLDLIEQYAERDAPR